VGSAVQASGKLIVEFVAAESGQKGVVIIIRGHWLEIVHAAEVVVGKAAVKIVIAVLVNLVRAIAAEFTVMVIFVMVQIIVTRRAFHLDIMKLAHKFS
jgi:hypothetical protein